MTSHDQLAAKHLLAGRPIPQSLVNDAAAASGDRCPECGSRLTEDNGATEYRCCKCDHRWGFEFGERYGF